MNKRPPWRRHWAENQMMRNSKCKQRLEADQARKGQEYREKLAGMESERESGKRQGWEVCGISPSIQDHHCVKCWVVRKNNNIQYVPSMKR